MMRDLSVCGVFFESTLTFVLGECLRLTLILERIDPGGRLCLDCQGRVMHIGPYGIRIGVAVGIMAHGLPEGYRTAEDAAGRRAPDEIIRRLLQ